MNLRNVAIIAHVDHGKTTLLDGLLKQSNLFRANESLMSAELIMDSNDQERERGITILAKTTAVTYKDTKINIIDTPGHADFGGEVERILNMADGAILLVDAKEGPMPQTKFVLKKALEMNLKVLVVVNKIDKPDANIDNTLHRVYDLFLELATDESQLEFPVLYAIGRDEKAWNEVPTDPTAAATLEPVFEAILQYVPAPQNDPNGDFQMLVSSLDWDAFKGKYCIGRIRRGTIKTGDSIILINANGEQEKVSAEKVYVNKGLGRDEVDTAQAGDIIALTGIKNARIGDTLAATNNPEQLPVIAIDAPTISITVGPNTSPFMGKEGSVLTGRHILSRIEKEVQTNIALRFEQGEGGSYILFGRGELHLSVFLEAMRREGFELEVGMPRVIIKEENGVKMEPLEELTIDVDNEYTGAINSEVGRRRGVLVNHVELTPHQTRLVFEITTRGILGIRSILQNLSKGTAVANSSFSKYVPLQGSLEKLRKGVLISSDTGKAAGYGLNIAQGKGPVFIGPGTEVYTGMIVGLNGRDQDLEINVTKGKQLTNMRASGSDDAIVLAPPTVMSLEQCLSFLEEDEVLEITPKNLRLRKKELDATKRYREARKKSA